MSKKVIITEKQLNDYLVFESKVVVLSEGLMNLKDIGQYKNKIKKYLVAGFSAVAIISALYGVRELDQKTRQELIDYTKQEEKVLSPEEIEANKWTLAADDVTATVYNAVKAQCNNDVQRTASMFKLNLNDVASHRIIAMERTFMQELGLKYGDVVKIEGTGQFDGVWQVQDTMNKRFAGQHKIDILVPRDIRTGKWNDVKLYVLKDKGNAEDYKLAMAGQHKA